MGIPQWCQQTRFDCETIGIPRRCQQERPRRSCPRGNGDTTAVVASSALGHDEIDCETVRIPPWCQQTRPRRRWPRSCGDTAAASTSPAPRQLTAKLCGVSKVGREEIDCETVGIPRQCPQTHPRRCLRRDCGDTAAVSENSATKPDQDTLSSKYPGPRMKFGSQAYACLLIHVVQVHLFVAEFADTAEVSPRIRGQPLRGRLLQKLGVIHTLFADNLEYPHGFAVNFFVTQFADTAVASPQFRGQLLRGRMCTRCVWIHGFASQLIRG